MHAVFTRNVAANPLIRNNSSWGNLRVKTVHRQAHQIQAAMALSADARDELLRLRKGNKRLQTERDILAKATAWFAGTSVHTATPSSRS